MNIDQLVNISSVDYSRFGPYAASSPERAPLSSLRCRKTGTA